ncbi:MAG TPA: C40 family peptidase [Actinomycetales bacterium]|nr:C40 family peptidase [Actinomycetales bacterium]
MGRPPRLALRAAAAVVALGCAGVLVPAASASADPSVAELRRQATSLRAELDRLAVRQDLAVERYDAAREELDRATTEQVLSTADLDDVRRSAAAAQARSTRRARALYMSGGSLALTASMLASMSIDDALTRWKAVEAVVGDEQARRQQADAQVRRSREEALSAARLRARTIAHRARAAAAVASVQAALAAQRDLLARTDARVVELAARQQREAEARVLATAAQSAARLGVAVSSRSAGVRAGVRVDVPSRGQEGGTTVRPADGRGLEGGTAKTQALPDVPAPSTAAASAIAAARTRLGMPYVWGATGPTSFDCSGLTQWAYRQAGVSIPRTSRQQYAGLPKVPLSQLAPGDLVFYATDVRDPSTIHHVGVYVGAGLSLYAPRTGSTVKIGPVGYGRIIGAARPSATRASAAG